MGLVSSKGETEETEGVVAVEPVEPAVAEGVVVDTTNVLIEEEEAAEPQPEEVIEPEVVDQSEDVEIAPDESKTEDKTAEDIDNTTGEESSQPATVAPAPAPPSKANHQPIAIGLPLEAIISSSNRLPMLQTRVSTVIGPNKTLGFGVPITPSFIHRPCTLRNPVPVMNQMAGFFKSEMAELSASRQPEDISSLVTLEEEPAATGAEGAEEKEDIEEDKATDIIEA